jgi:hypothetical protein
MRICAQSAIRRHQLITPTSPSVESRMGAVAWGLWPTPRFPSPLIKPDEPISGIRLSDQLHRKAHDGTLGAGVGGTERRVLDELHRM